MKKTYTISPYARLEKDKNNHTKTYIYKEDNYKLTFQELFEKIESLSNIAITNKKFGLPRLYQTPRKEISVDKILQGDSNYKQHLINILTLDFDSTKVTREFVEDQLIDYEFISYYSFSHSVKEGNRFRILIDLKDAVNLKRLNQKIKKNLLEEFKMEDDIPASESIKDSWMALPAYYECQRKPEVKYNIGNKLDLNSLIDKIEMEMKIKGQTKSKINNNVDANGEFNTERQKQSFQELINELYNTKDGEKHNAIVSFISKSSWIGIDPSRIRNIIFDYETNEDKLDNWIQLIDEWNKQNAISYYYRYEYKSFNGEDILYDNVEGKYLDYIKSEWIYQLPRMKKEKKEEYLNLLSEKSKLYSELYSKLGTHYLTKKMYDFIQIIKEQYDDTKLVTVKKYETPIKEGVCLSYKIYQSIMFNYFKFSKLNDNLDDINPNKAFDILNENKNEDDQTKLLKVLKEYIWVRKHTFELENETKFKVVKTYFSPKNNLKLIW